MCAQSYVHGTGQVSGAESESNISILTPGRRDPPRSATTTASLGLTPVRSAAYCPQCREGHPHATLRDTAPIHAAGRCKNQGKPGAARRCQEGRRSPKRKNNNWDFALGKEDAWA